MNWSKTFTQIDNLNNGEEYRIGDYPTTNSFNVPINNTQYLYNLFSNGFLTNVSFNNNIATLTFTNSAGQTTVLTTPINLANEQIFSKIKSSSNNTNSEISLSDGSVKITSKGTENAEIEVKGGSEAKVDVKCDFNVNDNSNLKGNNTFGTISANNTHTFYGTTETKGNHKVTGSLLIGSSQTNVAQKMNQNAQDISSLTSRMNDVENNVKSLKKENIDFDFRQAQDGTLTLITNVLSWYNTGNPLTTKIRARIMLYNNDSSYSDKYAFLQLVKFQINESPSGEFSGNECQFYFSNNDYNLLLSQDDNSSYHTIEFKQNKKYSHLITFTKGSNVMAFTLMNNNTTPITTSALLLDNLIKLGNHSVQSGFDSYELKLLASGTYDNTNIYNANITNAFGALNVYFNTSSVWNMSSTTIEDFVY